MTEKLTIARPYAKAAFSYALANNHIEEWSGFLNNLAEITKDERVVKIINNPTYTSDKIAGFLISFNLHTSQDKKLEEASVNFIKSLAENNRLVLLPEIATLYEGFKLKHNRLAEAQITSAVEISKDQQQKLQVALEKRLGVKVNLDFSVNPSLIGGMVVKTGDLVIDASVKGQLNKLLTKLAA